MTNLNPIRRLQLSILAIALLGASAISHAQTANWPQRPIKLIVPFAAGGNTDSIARLTAERLSQSLGQSVVVENKAGANGAIAADFVAQAAPQYPVVKYSGQPLLTFLVLLWENKPVHIFQRDRTHINYYFLIVDC